MTIIIKPTFNCNFRCPDCYLTNSVKSDTCIMSYKVAENLLHQVVSFCKKNNKRRLTFIWHGGEPLLWGIENYRSIFDFTKPIADDICIRQCVQTNLSLITNDYIKLFKQYNIEIGFSLDGPKEINDRFRKQIDGIGSHETIIRNLYRCRDAGLNVGAISVFYK